MRLSAPSSHRGGWRVLTGRALHSLYALARGKKQSILSIYDETQLLQRSAIENRAARATRSACAEGERRTEEATCWVTTGVAQTNAGHRVHCGDAGPTKQGRLRATPRSSGPPWLRSGWTRREDGRGVDFAACTENGRLVRLRSRLDAGTRHDAGSAGNH